MYVCMGNTLTCGSLPSPVPMLPAVSWSSQRLAVLTAVEPLVTVAITVTILLPTDHLTSTFLYGLQELFLELI